MTSRSPASLTATGFEASLLLQRWVLPSGSVRQIALTPPFSGAQEEKAQSLPARSVIEASLPDAMAKWVRC